MSAAITLVQRSALAVARRVLLLAHAPLPYTLLPTLVTLRSWVGSQRPGRRQGARQQMKFVVGGEVSETALQSLVKDYLWRMSWLAEARWKPGLVNRQRLVGISHIREALAEGRGCVLSFVHHGDYFGIFPSLANAGVEVHTLSNPQMLGTNAGLRARRMVEVSTGVRGSYAVDAGRGTAGVRELLGQGCLVAIALDQAGHTPLTFLGHELLLSSGGLRIARDLNVPVVVATSLADTPRGRATVSFSPPLRSGDFDSTDALREAVASLHEAAIMAWPTAFARPTRMTNRRLVKPPTEHHVTTPSKGT